MVLRQRHVWSLTLLAALACACGSADHEAAASSGGGDVSDDTSAAIDGGAPIDASDADDVDRPDAGPSDDADRVVTDAAAADVDQPDASSIADAGSPDGQAPDASSSDVIAADAATADPDVADPDVADTDAADAGAAKLGAPYPIILAHGFFGTDKFAGLNFATYFFGVKADLNKMGEQDVFTPAVDPFNSSTARGKALLAHVHAVLAKTGHAKVNIIGHSQGGLDARYVASVAPTLVASVVTVATPHKGSPVADIVLKLVPYPGVQAMIDALVKLIGKPIYTEDGKGSSVVTALKQFSPAQAKVFNAAHPNAAGVAYYSVTGRSGHALALKDCAPDEAHDFILKLKYNTDPIEPLLALTEAAIDGNLFDVKANDGLVRVEDAKWGTFLGCVPADHMDEVGHLFGDAPGLLNPFDHKAMYRWLVKMLRLKGF